MMTRTEYYKYVAQNAVDYLFDMLLEKYKQEDIDEDTADKLMDEELGEILGVGVTTYEVFDWQFGELDPYKDYYNNCIADERR